MRINLIEFPFTLSSLLTERSKFNQDLQRINLFCHFLPISGYSGLISNFTHTLSYLKEHEILHKNSKKYFFRWKKKKVMEQTSVVSFKNHLFKILYLTFALSTPTSHKIYWTPPFALVLPSRCSLPPPSQRQKLIPPSSWDSLAL